MTAHKPNLKNLKRGRILRLNELKASLNSKEPVWVYIKEYSNSKAKIDQADIGIAQDDGIKFISGFFSFNGLKDKDNCIIDLEKKPLMKKSVFKIYKALPTKAQK